VIWTIHVWLDSFICDMTRLWITDIWHDSWMCEMTHSYVTWLISMWHDSFICKMTYSYVTWLIHMWHDSYCSLNIVSMYTGSAFCEWYFFFKKKRTGSHVHVIKMTRWCVYYVYRVYTHTVLMWHSFNVCMRMWTCMVYECMYSHALKVYTHVCPFTHTHANT